MGTRITLTTFSLKLTRTPGTSVRRSTWQVRGQRTTLLACPVTKELSQVRNIKSWSRTLNSHLFSGSSTLLLFSFFKSIIFGNFPRKLWIQCHTSEKLLSKQGDKANLLRRSPDNSRQQRQAQDIGRLSQAAHGNDPLKFIAVLTTSQMSRGRVLIILVFSLLRVSGR